jgi:serine/threonine protein kinase
MTHVYNFSTFLESHCFSSNFPIPEDATASCNFITFLAAAQKLEIPFLPVTWQNNRQLLGRGGTSQISQALINQRTSFAFKRVAEKDKLFKSEEEIFRCLINEITVLDHLVEQNHPNILELQGICWDISNDSQHDTEETPLQPSDDYKVWPALVFEKSQYGDLYYFAGLPVGQRLNVEERLKICQDVGNAIAHLQSIGNSASYLFVNVVDVRRLGIVHGDIKPDNVLIFKGDDGSFTAKVADFGFSTRYSHVGDCIVLPQSQPWCAPEWDEYPEFPPAQAIKTDVFSFGMLILWFLFEKSLLGDSPLPEGSQSHRARYTYENRFHSLEFLSNLKRENSLVQFAKQLVIAEEGLDANMRQILQRFFSGCLTRNPEARHLDVQHALKHLSLRQHESLASAQESTGHYETTELAANTIAEVHLPVDSDFKVRSRMISAALYLT